MIKKTIPIYIAIFLILSSVSYLYYKMSNIPNGPTGSTGPTGFTGPQGIQGPIGLQGLKGDIGPIGPQGLLGPIGPQGIQGLLGPTGPQGLIGNIGPTGIQGIQGIQGPTGPQGLIGLTGPQGIQGIQGLTGPTGPIGPQGIQGIQGATGSQGIQGIQGLTGPMGIGNLVRDYSNTINSIYQFKIQGGNETTPRTFDILNRKYYIENVYDNSQNISTSLITLTGTVYLDQDTISSWYSVSPNPKSYTVYLEIPSQVRFFVSGINGTIVPKFPKQSNAAPTGYVNMIRNMIFLKFFPYVDDNMYISKDSKNYKFYDFDIKLYTNLPKLSPVSFKPMAGGNILGGATLALGVDPSTNQIITVPITPIYDNDGLPLNGITSFNNTNTQFFLDEKDQLRYVPLANKCVDIGAGFNGTSGTAGVPAFISDCWGGDQQKFFVDTYGTIRNKVKQNICLDNTGNVSTAGNVIKSQLCGSPNTVPTSTAWQYIY